MTGDQTATHETGGDDRSGRSEAMGWVLRIAYHPDPRLSLASYTMLVGTSASVGRAFSGFGEGALCDGDVSREHLRLEASQAHLFMTCTGKNGVTIRGEPCPRHERVPLRDGDVLSIPTSRGAIILVVRFTRVDVKVRRHDTIVGVSAEVAALLLEIEAVAERKTPVLIRGPSGSGKDVTARAIHEAGGRRECRYQSVNCAELMEETFHSEIYGHKKGSFTGATSDRSGLADAAGGGTLFLNEVADANLGIQARLLSFLDDKKVRQLGSDAAHEVDLRIICASNADFEALVREQRFRKDLYFRIKGDTIQVPPLRARLEDVPLLAAHFVDQIDARKRRLDHRLMLALLCHPWPGNVREMRQLITCAVSFAGGSETIPLSPRIAGLLAESARLEEPVPPAELSGLAGRVEPPPGSWHSVSAPPRQPISAGGSPRRARAAGTVPGRLDLQRLIARCGGKIAAAAVELGVPRPTLYRWLQEAGVEPSWYRPPGNKWSADPGVSRAEMRNLAPPVTGGRKGPLS